MSTTTTNYSLIKPALSDASDITAMNGNWDTLDGLLAGLSSSKVPATRKVNGKALSTDIELDAEDVGAPPEYHAAEETTYGKGDTTLYGHLKLSSSTTSSLGENDGTAATPAAVSSVRSMAAGKATTATYSASVGTTWTATNSAAPYTQTVSVTGLLSTDNPVVALDLSGVAYSDVTDKQSAYGQIYRAVTANGTLTLYSHAALTTALTLQLKVVR